MGASNSAVKQSEDGSGTLHNGAVSGNSPLRQGGRTNTTRDTLQAPRATCHVSRLATSSVRLSSLYSASPVCSPSRAALLTGDPRHAHHS